MENHPEDACENGRLTYNLSMKTWITVETFVKAPIEKVWAFWNEPEHITKWAFGSDDWCAPRATNDLRVGGKLIVRMEAKDGSAGFDMEGTYTTVELNKKIEYALGDRRVTINFTPKDGGCSIVESFEAEDVNPIEMQKNGWQTILNNFKKHVEL